MQAPKEPTLSALKTLVEVFRRCGPTRRQWVLNAPRRIVLSFAPSAAAGRHFDRVEATYDSKTERRTFFLSFASRPFTTEAKNKASLILLVSFRSCSRLILGRIRWRYLCAFFVVATLKKQRKNRNRICPKLYLPRICVRLSLRLFASVVTNSMKAEVI